MQILKSRLRLSNRSAEQHLEIGEPLISSRAWTLMLRGHSQYALEMVMKIANKQKTVKELGQVG